MKAKPRQHFEARAQIAKAMAHPSRLMILDALGEKELCVCDLTELVGADQSTVSKHLTVLKNAGLVSGRKEGSMIYYRVQCSCLDGFFECIESVLKRNLKTQQQMVRLL